MPTAECEALVALYEATDGDNWTDNTGWLLSADPCSWFGVFCSGGQVVLVNLFFNNLTGPIPTELGNLPALFRLHLESNNLTGSIPSELGNLPALSGLHLESNQLSGPIPAELGNLTALTILVLNSNALSGSIPAELGSLTGLRLLWLDANQLSGLVPVPVVELGGKLEQIALDRCRFQSNPGLFMPDSQDYMDADLDNDGVICGIALSTPSP